MTERMTAAVYHGPNDLRVEQVPVPEIGDQELRIHVLNANICGTDLRILHGGHRKYPPGTVRIPGHEVCGEIESIGDRIEQFEKGQRVVIAPNMGRPGSRQTVSGNNNLDPDYQGIGINLEGAFAEYMRVPSLAIQQGNVLPIDEEIDSAQAALIEPLACVVRGQDALDVGVGDTVVVMGAGPIGILHMKLARLRGALNMIVSQPTDERRKRARRLGADRVVDPRSEDLKKSVDEETNGRGADVVIVAAPAKEAQTSALEVAGTGGRINYFGGLPKQDSCIAFDSNKVHYKELVVTGTTACSTHDCVRAADIVNSGRLDLDPVVTDRYPLEEAPEAFEAAEEGKNLRVSLEP